MVKIKYIRFLIVFVLLILASITPFVAAALDSCHYKSADSIEKARIDTERILDRFEKDGNTDEINYWLTYGPSEAPRMAALNTFAQWATDHPQDFVNIVEGLPEKNKNNFIRDFSACLSQSGQLGIFKSAFSSIKSPLVQQMLNDPPVKKAAEQGKIG